MQHPEPTNDHPDPTDQVPPDRSDARARTGYDGSVVVDAPLDEVFDWHRRPGALQRLLPPWQPIKVGSEATSLKDGRAVLRLPAGVRWVAQHSDYDPPHRFVDELVSLPLRWRHTHTFSAESSTTTRVRDRVQTPVPASVLRSTFTYRNRQLTDDLAVHARMRHLAPHPMTVAVTGSSGLVGTALTALLSTGGHTVIRLVRQPTSAAGQRFWDPSDPAPDLLEGVDAVIHLAGASIAGRFSEKHRKAIRDSRTGPTRELAELLAERAPDGPRTFISASAIGYYGPDRGDEALPESAEQGDGFLAEVVADWEAATDPARDAGVRVVTCRTGIVQSARGGMLALLRPLFSAGLGGRLGDGQQWTSWIDLDDLIDIYYRALVDDTLTGPLNAVAPEAERNAGFTSTLARVLHRPALLPVPSIGPRILLGSRAAREVAMAGQRVLPTRLAEAGHTFRRPALEPCLRHQLGRF